MAYHMQASLRLVLATSNIDGAEYQGHLPWRPGQLQVKLLKEASADDVRTVATDAGSGGSTLTSTSR